MEEIFTAATGNTVLNILNILLEFVIIFGTTEIRIKTGRRIYSKGRESKYNCSETHEAAI